jgi:hypothetical protein
MSAVLGERLQMMKLEIARFAAALTTPVDISTAPVVSLINLTPQRCRYVSTAWRLETLGTLFRRHAALARRY